MKYLHTASLQIQRSYTKDIILGGTMLAVIVFIIGGLFIASLGSSQLELSNPIVSCYHGVDGFDCNLP